MKRYIRSSKTVSAVDYFMIADIDDLSFKDVSEAVDEYASEYEDLQSREGELAYLDSIYEMKRSFYQKYKPFVDKCKEIVDTTHYSGYGMNDYMLSRIVNKCRWVENNFPYGWRKG